MKKILILSVSGWIFSVNANAIKNSVDHSLQFNPASAAQFESTNTCVDCNLSYYTTKPSTMRSGSNLSLSNLTYASVGRQSENWQNSNLSGVLGTSTRFVGDFTYANFQDSKLYVSTFMGTFHKANFRNAMLNNSVMASDSESMMADFSHADFSYAKLNNARCIRSDFNGADFSYASLNNITLGGLRSVADAAKFNHADLTNADMSRTSFVGADFTGANLTGVNFTRANLCGANITQTQLDTVKSLSGAVKPDCSGRYPVVRVLSQS